MDTYLNKEKRFDCDPIVFKEALSEVIKQYDDKELFYKIRKNFRYL